MSPVVDMTSCVGLSRVRCKTPHFCLRFPPQCSHLWSGPLGYSTCSRKLYLISAHELLSCYRSICCYDYLCATCAAPLRPCVCVFMVPPLYTISGALLPAARRCTELVPQLRTWLIDKRDREYLASIAVENDQRISGIEEGDSEANNTG